METGEVAVCSIWTTKLFVVSRTIGAVVALGADIRREVAQVELVVTVVARGAGLAAVLLRLVLVLS